MGNIDYKAKFEKAMKDIAKIRKANKDNTELVEFIDFNYPELKETPTERMMKALLWFLGAFPYGKEVADGVTVCELVAWLEEDVKPKLDSMRNPTEWSEDDEKIGRQLLNWFKDCKWDAIDNETLKRDDIIAWLEKQGGSTKLSEEELNSITKGVLTSYAMAFINYLDEHRYEGKMDVSNGECEDIENAFHNAMFDKLHRYYCKYIEKQGEQNPTDKTEPKFKIEKGQWYVCIQSFILNGNIVVTEGRTYKSQEDNVVSGEDSRLFIDKLDGDASEYFRLWTIQDAKDGDVLLFEGNYNSIVLFQGIGINGEGRINYHCKCDLGNYSIGIQGDVACLGTVDKDADHYQPATKKQRDLLFSKMKEAGYYWDYDKKALRHIEQEQTELPKGEDYAIDGLWQAVQILEHSLGEVDGWQSDDGILEHKCAIEAVKRLYEQNPAWSEEDEKHLLGCINYFSGITKSSPYYNDYLWLKSIKKRYYWKPSDEQMATFWDAICNLNQDGYKWINDMKSLYYDLKKLRKE